MPRFEFRADPAWVTVGEGLSLGFRHWRATAIYWAIPVLLVGIISTIAYWGMQAGIEGSLPPSSEVYDPYTGEIDLLRILAPMVPQLVVSTLVLGSVTLVARWVYYALAIKGLRGGEITSGWLIARGLRAFVVDMLIMLSATGLAGVLFLVGTSAGIGLALLLGAIAFSALLYIEVRLVFWPLAIFDGAGILEALAGSWRASEGAVLRMIGWALAAGGVGLVVNIGVSIVTAPLSRAIPLQSGIKAGVTEALAVFVLFTLAVLYESQLRRNLPERASPPPPTVEALRPWPGYAPADPGSPAPGTGPWPAAPAPGSAPGSAPAAPASGPWSSWDTPPINPDAPATWDTEPGDPEAPPPAPQPPAPPA